MGVRRAAIGVLVLLAALGAADDALAGPIATVTGEPYRPGSPAIAGDRAALILGSPSGIRVTAFGDDARPVTLYSDPSSSPADWRWLAASASHVVLERQPRGEFPQVLASTGGDWQRIDDPTCDINGNVAIDGEVVAWPATCHDPYQQGIYVRDLSAAGPAQLAVSDDSWWIIELRIAGRYLAWHRWAAQQQEEGMPRRDQLVVFDRVAGREAYHVDITTLAGYEPPCADQRYLDFGCEFHLNLALQPDGKLFVAYSQEHHPTNGPSFSDPVQLAWFSPAEPTPHVIPVALAKTPIAAANDLVFVLLHDPLEFAVVDLAGNVVNHVERPRYFYPGDLAFDGQRLAWASTPAFNTHVVRTARFPADPTALTDVRLLRGKRPALRLRASEPLRVDVVAHRCRAVRGSICRSPRFEGRMRRQVGPGLRRLVLARPLGRALRRHGAHRLTVTARSRQGRPRGRADLLVRR